MSELSILDWLLSNSRVIDPKEIPSLEDWKYLFFDQATKWQSTIDMAISGSFISDRLAYAFAAGYWSALYCLIPSLPERTITALCVTEKGGNHPKAIQTELVPASGKDEPVWLLNGSKKFVTCANEADMLLIAASTGISPKGQNELRLVRVDNHTPGLLIKPIQDLPFIPEISHGELEIYNIQIAESQILPGDGYTNYIKPFRTLEDLHVTSSVLGYLFRTACLFNWPQSVKEQILAFLPGIKTISLSNPLQSTVHIVFGGISSLFSSFIKSIEPHWRLTDDKTRSQWERDKALLNISGKAQSQRLSSAWAQYES
ncbi:MAG: acyl-CoA dehydrogenase family protein [Deltaproteobacteria bacterium]|nr:acyl-CoA dehydrogenase family protein [Deltaproteobacteria bacterium]